MLRHAISILSIPLLLLCATGCVKSQPPDSPGTPAGKAKPTPKSDNIDRLGQVAGQNRDTLLIEFPEARKLGFTVVWETTLTVPRGGWIRLFVLDDLVVVLQRPANTATILSLKTGNPIWNKQVGGKLDRVISAGRNKKHILINTQDKLKIYQADSGNLVTTQRLAQRVDTAPVIVGDKAVFGGINGLVFAHNVRDGAVDWKYQMQGEIHQNPISGGANRVFVATKNGEYAMFSIDRARPLWKGRLFGRISAQPVSSELGVFVACEDHNIYSLNLANGVAGIGWPFRTTQALKTDPVLIDNFLFQMIPGRGLTAIDVTKDKTLWIRGMTAKPTVAIKHGILFNDKTRLIVIEPNTGRRRNEASTLEIQDIHKASKGTLILLSPTGRVLRMDPVK